MKVCWQSQKCTLFLALVCDIEKCDKGDQTSFIFSCWFCLNLQEDLPKGQQYCGAIAADWSFSTRNEERSLSLSLSRVCVCVNESSRSEAHLVWEEGMCQLVSRVRCKKAGSTANQTYWIMWISQAYSLYFFCYLSWMNWLPSFNSYKSVHCFFLPMSVGAGGDENGTRNCKQMSKIHSQALLFGHCHHWRWLHQWSHTSSFSVFETWHVGSQWEKTWCGLLHEYRILSLQLLLFDVT